MKKYFIIFIIILLMPFNVKAISCLKGEYEAEIYLEKDKIYVGDNIHFKINSNTFFKTTYQSENENIIKVENGEITALLKGESTIDIIIEFIENNEIKDSCITKYPLSIYEANAVLKDLTIQEYDLKDIFKSDVYNYEITLPYKIDNIHIGAIPLSENSQVIGDGEKALKVGLNEFKITVEEGSESITYTLSIFREEGNHDATLKNLIVDGYVLNPQFNKNNYNYYLEVGKDINEINIKATPNNSNAIVNGNGRFDLTTGENTFKVIVTSESGEKKTYQIKVNKNKGSSTLKNLVIDGFNLDTPFQSDKFTYYLEVNYKINSIKITPEANEDDQVEILNNTSLNYGKNEILIRVTSPDKTTTTYKLIVTRLKKDNHNWEITNILFYIFIILIFVMISLIIIFINRNIKKQDKPKKFKERK